MNGISAQLKNVWRIPIFFPRYRVTCLYISVTLLVVLIWSIIDYKPTGYGAMVFPPWAQGVGWTLLLLALLLIPLFALWTFRKLYSPLKTIKENIAVCFRPSTKWAPHDRKYRTGRYVGTVLPHDIAGYWDKFPIFPKFPFFSKFSIFVSKISMKCEK